MLDRGALSWLGLNTLGHELEQVAQCCYSELLRVILSLPLLFSPLDLMETHLPFVTLAMLYQGHRKSHVVLLSPWTGGKHKTYSILAMSLKVTLNCKFFAWLFKVQEQMYCDTNFCTTYKIKHSSVSP